MQKTDLSRFATDTDKLFGIYRGVVEDRLDPLRMGRVRVRIWGVHTEEQAGGLNQVPALELPWAHPIGPNFEGSCSDSGAFCVPLCGTHVVVFFEAGNMMQPRYFGTAPGWPVDKYQQFVGADGYIDPAEIYPLDDHIDEQDWHRLNRVENIDKSYIEIKRPNLDLAVPIAYGGEWDENPPMYEAIYPDNNIFATHFEFDTNMVFEFDATEARNRIAWWHPSKSYMEINFEGRQVMRNTFHRYDICDGSTMKHVMKDYHKDIKGNLTTLIEECEWRQVKDDRYTNIIDNDDLKVYGWRSKFVINIDKEMVLDKKTSFILDNKLHYLLADYDRLTLGDDKQFILGDHDMFVSGDDVEWIITDKKTGVIGNELEWIAGDKNKFVIGFCLDWQTSTKEKVTFTTNKEWIGVNKRKWINGNEKDFILISKEEFVVGHSIEESGTLWSIEAPVIFLNCGVGADVPIEPAPAPPLPPGLISMPWPPMPPLPAPSPPGPPPLYEPAPAPVKVKKPEPACP